MNDKSHRIRCCQQWQRAHQLTHIFLNQTVGPSKSLYEQIKDTRKASIRPSNPCESIFSVDQNPETQPRDFDPDYQYEKQNAFDQAGKAGSLGSWQVSAG